MLMKRSLLASRPNMIIAVMALLTAIGIGVGGWKGGTILPLLAVSVAVGIGASGSP